MQSQLATSSLRNIRSKQPWLVLSAAEKFSLAVSNDTEISHYYSFEVNEKKDTIFAIPDGCIDILFDCDSGDPAANVYGTPLEAADIQLNPGHKYFGIRFSAGVIPDFLGASAKDFIGNYFKFLDVCPYDNQLFDQVVTAPTFSDQVALFKEFYTDKTTRKRSIATAQLIDVILTTNGNIKTKEMENITGYTRRTLHRQFQDDMGISPKYFSRIVRFQSAVHSIKHTDDISLSHLATDLGFSDQAHFQKEFKKLCHATPSLYKARIKHESYNNKIEYTP